MLHSHSPNNTKIRWLPLDQGCFGAGNVCLSQSPRWLWEMAVAGWGTSDNAHCTDLAKEQGASAHRVRTWESEHGGISDCPLQVYLNPNLPLELSRGGWTVKSRRICKRFSKQAKVLFSCCLNLPSLVSLEAAGRTRSPPRSCPVSPPHHTKQTWQKGLDSLYKKEEVHPL